MIIFWGANKMKKSVFILIGIILLFLVARTCYYTQETESVKKEFVSIYTGDKDMDSSNPLYTFFDELSVRRNKYGYDYKLTIKKWRVRVRGNTGRIWVKYYVDFYADGEVIYTIDYTNPGFVILIEKVNGIWDINGIKIVP